MRISRIREWREPRLHRWAEYSRLVLHVSASDDRDWAAVDALPVVGFHMAGNRTPLVLIRTWTNELAGHARLAGALGVDQPVVSLGIEMTADDFPRSVSAWADRAVDSARMHADPERVLIGGFSFGGVVALEIADRLQRSGNRVGQAVLLDTSIPRPKERARPGLVLAAARRVVATTEEIKGDFPSVLIYTLARAQFLLKDCAVNQRHLVVRNHVSKTVALRPSRFNGLRIGIYVHCVPNTLGRIFRRW